MDTQRIVRCFEEHVPESAGVVIGVSGGVDSVVLLRVLAGSVGRRLVVAHFNHMLRGGDADADEAFVRSLAAELALPYRSEAADVARHCAEAGVGIEEGARMLRHAFFDRVARGEGCSFLALAHHADDRAETALLNLMRGAGARGIGAMPAYDPRRRIVRPLAGIRKAAVVAYAVERGWTWREDATNACSDHDRNWLRNDVIPAMEGRRKGVVEVIVRSSEQFAALQDFVEGHAREWLERSAAKSASGRTLFFDGEEFLSLHPVLRGEILAQVWARVHGSRRGFERRRLDEVERWLRTGRNGAKVWFGPDAVLVNRNGKVGCDCARVPAAPRHHPAPGPTL